MTPLDQLNQLRQIAIIGTGLLGASVALGLKAAGYTGRIVGVGRRQATLEAAVARGAIDRGTTDPADVLPDSQLAIVAVPLGGFATVFEQIAQHDHDQLVITDVGSTKLDVLEAAHALLPNPARFVGSHPMAGSEQQGPEAARADLFRGKPCVVTAEPDTDPAAKALVESLWQVLGMTLIHMSAQDHDAHTAVISHLPHAVSVLLVQVAAERGGWDVASTGFRDTTRLASSNPPMRADILTANREQVVEALKAFRHRLDKLVQTLDRNDRDALLAMLEHTRDVREAWLRERENHRDTGDE